MKKLPKISICIPTHNRHEYLDRCLRSIELAYIFHPYQIEVCVFDSSETNESRRIVDKYAEFLNIKYLYSPENQGYAGNFKNCVSMAGSRMAWLIGDDDLLVQNSLKIIDDLFSEFPNVDFFYCNAFHLDEEFFKEFKKPFDTQYLPLKMSKFTSIPMSRLIPFHKLIDFRVSFDFLGGMFLSIFNRELWELNKSCVKDETSKSRIKFLDLDSTFPHSKIFANTFMKSDAYLLNNPLVVAVAGVREWTEYYPFIRTFRLIDLLIEYRQNGLSYFSYWKNKNSTVKHFAYDAMYSISKKNDQSPKIRLSRYIVYASTCPNFYFSFIKLILYPLKKMYKYTLALIATLLR
jgi:glycosyltransferase involved in cell wall biosynthesis